MVPSLATSTGSSRGRLPLRWLPPPPEDEEVAAAASGSGCWGETWIEAPKNREGEKVGTLRLAEGQPGVVRTLLRAEHSETRDAGGKLLFCAEGRGQDAGGGPAPPWAVGESLRRGGVRPPEAALRRAARMVKGGRRPGRDLPPSAKPPSLLPPQPPFRTAARLAGLRHWGA